MLEFELEKTTKNYDLYRQVDGINRLYLPRVPNPPHKRWFKEQENAQ